MQDNNKFKPNPNLKLIDQVKQVLRYHHYAYRTEQTYCDWIVKYIKFFGCQNHPKNMGKIEIEAFLSHLAVNLNVSKATQDQAFNAILFLYNKVLDIKINDQLEATRAKRRKQIPVVMTQQEVISVLKNMRGTHLLMAKLLYGSGLRLMECVRLRIQDIDFSRNKIYIRAAKGSKDRITVFPHSIQEQLKIHIEDVKNIHNHDLINGYGVVYLPHALEKKYPNANSDIRWQYVFPAKKLSKDPRSDKIRRHHVQESGLQKAVKIAVKRTGIMKPVSCHTFRHCFATHMLENGVNIRVVQELMGHADVKTTEIYTHVMEKNIDAVISPLDSLNPDGLISEDKRRY